MTFDELFRIGTTHPQAREWQRTLASEAACANRLINICTGLGKTEGVMFAWLWNRVVRQDAMWPRRLVWCLPMRVLVEQTAERLQGILARLTIQAEPDFSRIQVHRLLGGAATEEWHLAPERNAILVGTQDMLLSRALNRGYASARARWPVEYGLVNHDALWVMDEVQLMDVGLVTSVQLQMYRESAEVTLRPSHTWWMSATLQSAWLETPESQRSLPSMEQNTVTVPPEDAKDPTWHARKAVRVQTIPAREDRKHTAFAHLIWEEHQVQPAPAASLVVVNRVDTATNIARELSRAAKAAGRATEIKIVHSRFRGRERREWSASFLNRAASEDPTTDRIIVATQVIEAGVDISCARMITELAPWPSLVQRFGRVARYGGAGRIVVVDRDLSGKDTVPYDEISLAAARDALKKLSGGGPGVLREFEASLSQSARAALYPYEPLHVLTPREYEELFDTTADLSGADVDISRFIRSGDDRDLSVAWIIDAAVKAPGADLEPRRDDLCPVPVARAKEWLFDGSGLKDGCRSWVWDYVDGQWRRADRRDLYPGQVVLVGANWGGYDVLFGFSGEPAKVTGSVVHPIAVDTAPSIEGGDRAEERDDASAPVGWETIATHGLEVGAEAHRISDDVGLPPSLCYVAELAGRLHDWGKSHPAFRASIRADADRDGIRDLAKAPPDAWMKGGELYPEPAAGEVHRRGLRHELASMLAILELVAPDPLHETLVARLGAAGALEAPSVGADSMANTLLAELSALSRDDLNLLLYLVCSHHGKVRVGLHLTAHDQEYPVERYEPERGLPLRGIRDGDVLPSTRLYDRAGQIVQTPALALHLDIAAIGLSPRYGASWSERVISVRRRFGPAGAAFLEALFRAADIRATCASTPDPLIPEVVLS